MKSSNYSERTLKEKVTDHAFRILKKLDCSKSIREEVLSILERADKHGLLTKGTPKGFAAGAVYIACIFGEDRMTLYTIGGDIGLSVSTVSKSYMFLARGLGFSER